MLVSLLLLVIAAAGLAKRELFFFAMPLMLVVSIDFGGNAPALAALTIPAVLLVYAVVSFSAARRSTLAAGAAFTVALVAISMNSSLEPSYLLQVLAYACSGLFAALAGQGCNNASRLRAFVWGTAAATTVLFFQMLLIYSTLGISLADGVAWKASIVVPLGASNYLAAVANLAVAAVLVFREQSSRLPLVAIVLFGSGAVILSASKWGLLTLLMTLTALAISEIQRSRGRHRVPRLFAAVLVSFFLAGNLASTPAYLAIDSGGFALSGYTSGAARTEIWAAYWLQFRESPILGSGIGEYAVVWGKPYLAHNVLLQLLGEGGFLLLVAFGTLVGVLVVAGSAVHGWRMVLFLSLVLFANMMEPAMFTLRYDTLLFLILGASSIPMTTVSQKDPQGARSSRQKPAHAGEFPLRGQGSRARA